MLTRLALEAEVRAALQRSPAVALIGPRQVGKTTLARALLGADSANYFDLEDPQVEAQLVAPMTALKDLRGLIVIDEVQHAPDLFKVLRVLIDRADDQVLRIARPDAAYFWATHGGAELDLLMFKDGRRVGVEFKRADAPSLTPSMRSALNDLALDALYVVYPGTRRYRINDRVEAVPLTALLGPRR